MKPSHRRWLIAGICALLLMSSFSVYITLRDRKAIDESFAACRMAADSISATRDAGLSYVSARDSAVHANAPDTRLRDLRIRAAENRIRLLHELEVTQVRVKIADYKKLWWSSLMGVAGLIGLVIIFAGRQDSTS